ncbi:hypothetical protein FOPE_12682 [Fonsecaea pedrosoi]|nr:hypothetical protein FOPE_12682 [Fonsecaea pedrosoi]
MGRYFYVCPVRSTRGTLNGDTPVEDSREGGSESESDLQQDQLISFEHWALSERIYASTNRIFARRWKEEGRKRKDGKREEFGLNTMYVYIYIYIYLQRREK